MLSILLEKSPCIELSESAHFGENLLEFEKVKEEDKKEIEESFNRKEFSKQKKQTHGICIFF